MGVSYKIFKKFDEVRILWQTLEREGDLVPFQSFYWMNCWYNTIGNKEKNLQLRIIYIEFNCENKILIPLGITKHLLIKKLSYIGNYQSDYMLPIISKNFSVKKNTFSKVWNKVINDIGYVDLISFNQQTHFINRTPNPFFDIYKSILVGRATHTNLNNKWDETYNYIFSSKTRQTDRRKLKKVKLNGEYKFLIANTIKEKDGIIKAMIQQKIKRFNKTNVWNMFSKQEYIEFYQSHSKRENSSRFKMHFSAIMINDIYIATHFGIIFNDTFFYLMAGQDEESFSKFSPGRLLVIELMSWASHNKLKIFDFTGGNELYKEHWATSQVPIYNMIKINSFLGEVYYFFETLLKKMKKFKILKGKIKSIYLYVFK